MKTQLPEKIQNKRAVRAPDWYQVLILNDDYTPMIFVVEVLKKFFFMSDEQAVALMWEVHTVGQVGFGVFTHDVAQSKAALVNVAAQRCEYPLCCMVEKIVPPQG